MLLYSHPSTRFKLIKSGKIEESIEVVCATLDSSSQDRMGDSVMGQFPIWRQNASSEVRCKGKESEVQDPRAR